MIVSYINPLNGYNESVVNDWVSQIQTTGKFELKYTELASPLIAMGIVATSLFFVKSVKDKRRLNSLINS